MKNLKIRKEDAVLVIIDMQERLMPAMKDGEDAEAALVKLARGCRILEVPVLVTQQYTKGLGSTVPEVEKAVAGGFFARDGMGEESVRPFEPVEKTSFSAMGEPAFVSALKASGRKTVILTGVESHVCVQQTCLDLLEEGYSVFLAVDCVASRRNSDKKQAVRRMTQAGAVGTTFESVLFELTGGAKEEGFRQISALVK